MKWKKGSPGKAGMYICKLRVCDEGLMYYPVSYQQFLNNKWINPSVFHQPGDIIEWLDESKGELISAEEILHKWVPKDIWKCGSRSEIVVTYAEAISAMEEYGKQIIDTKVVGETTGENEGWVSVEAFRMLNESLKHISEIEGGIAKVKPPLFPGGSVPIIFKNGKGYWLKIDKMTEVTLDLNPIT